MSQTYPTPITKAMVARVGDGTPFAKTAEKDPGISTGRNLGASYYEPDTWAEKASAPVVDYVPVTVMSIATNQPYATS